MKDGSRLLHKFSRSRDYRSIDGSNRSRRVRDEILGDTVHPHSRETLVILRDLIDEALAADQGGDAHQAQTDQRLIVTDSWPVKVSGHATHSSLPEQAPANDAGGADRIVTIGGVALEVPADGSPTYYAMPNGGKAHIVIAVDFANKEFTTLNHVRSDSVVIRLTPASFISRWKNDLGGMAVRRADPPITGTGSAVTFD
jgi:hypothetical protein